MTVEILTAALFVWLGTTVQSAVGFGIGLVAIPLLIWVGHSLPDAIAIILGAGLVQAGIGLYTRREHLHLRVSLPIAFFQWLAVPVGVLTMQAYLVGQQALTKQLIGALLVTLLLAGQIAKPEPRERVRREWGFAAGSAGGFLAGIAGMGGPPLVVFASMHRWDKERFRVFMWTQYALAVPVLVGALSLGAGVGVLWAFVLGVALAPVAWLGAQTGFALSRRWNRARLQVVVKALLYAIGVMAVLSPWLPFGR